MISLFIFMDNVFLKEGLIDESDNGNAYVHTSS